MKLLKSITKQLQTPEFKFILTAFLIWRISLFIILFLAINFLPLSGPNFFGGGLKNYLTNPWLYGWANFDGEHYLSIAQSGYKSLEQAFFPMYPLLIHLNGQIFGESLWRLTVIGIFISNLSFLLALYLLYKLIKLDYPENLAKLVVVLILVFPTSFYFGAVYSESIFLLLTVSAFYFLRTGNPLSASISGAFASATRVFGIILFPAFLIETYQKKQGLKWFWLALIPTGFIAYAVYQAQTVGDALAFYHLQTIVGPQHQGGIVLLPQIYFRYIKILLTTPPLNPIYQTTILEFLTGLLFFILPIYAFFKKMRWSYLFLGIVSFLMPTIQGSFSSTPRYVIVLFPSFIALALLLENSPKWVRMLWIGASSAGLVLETMLFLRGYWVA